MPCPLNLTQEVSAMSDATADSRTDATMSPDADVAAPVESIPFPALFNPGGNDHAAAAFALERDKPDDQASQAAAVSFTLAALEDGGDATPRFDLESVPFPALQGESSDARTEADPPPPSLPALDDGEDGATMVNPARVSL
ncbi:MAG: hypothetical protein H7831_06360, partial [Magnetococcus sp. WYHC-3]